MVTFNRTYKNISYSFIFSAALHSLYRNMYPFKTISCIFICLQDYHRLISPSPDLAQTVKRNAFLSYPCLPLPTPASASRSLTPRIFAEMRGIPAQTYPNTRSNKELSEPLPSLVWGVTQSQGSHVCPAAFCRRKSVVDSMLNTSVASVNSIQSQCPRIRKGDLTFFHKKCCFLLIY